MSLTGIETHSLRCVAFDPDSRWLIAGGGTMVKHDGRSTTVRELMAWNLPGCDVRWHVVEDSDDPISVLSVRPGGVEFATKGTGDITIWSAAGQPLRKFKNEFLAGPIAYSEDGQRYVSPAENSVKVRDSDSGRVVATIPISPNVNTTAQAAAFIPGTTRLVVAVRVINNRGHISGKMLLVDVKEKTVLKSSNVDLDASLVAVDPRGRWVCVAGQRRNRGCLLFWDLAKWRPLAEQGAHGKSIDGLAVSQDGEQFATFGADCVVRIWEAAIGKTLARLDKHRADGKYPGKMAWSPGGRYIALACMGSPPYGGVFLYERVGGIWMLRDESSDEIVATAKCVEARADVKQPGRLPKSASASEAVTWLRAYLKKHAAKKPLTAAAKIAAWENKHKIKLPQAYVDFVTTIGKHMFDDVLGKEGYSVRIVGPTRLDAIEYRRDPPEESSEEADPDGLMFAVAVNGDCFCFDLRGSRGQYSVYRFDHEMEVFELFAENFAAAVRRMVNWE